VSIEALTPDQLDALQRWGSGLQREGGSEELRAAGRAITLLIDELARVQREHWHERVGIAPIESPEPQPRPVAPPVSPPQPTGSPQGPFRDVGRAALSPQPV
jgi:hypothetical protein